MADKPWKRWEREGAADLGGTRSGPLGHDVPDSLDVALVAPEFKLYTKFVWLEKDWEQATRNAARFGKIPVLAVKEKLRFGRKRAQLNWPDFVTLHRLAVKGAMCSKQETTCRCGGECPPSANDEAASAAPS